MAFPLNTGTIVYGADYNTVQVLVQQVLGTGYTYGPGTANPSYGYNQPLQSTSAVVTAVITESQFQRLANDVNTASIHQTGANFTGYSTVYANTNTIISPTSLNLLYNNMATFVTNRFVVAPTQVTSAATTYYRSTNWGSNTTAPVLPAITNTNTITFASNNAMQLWFNQGGSIVFQGVYRGSPQSQQDTSWQSETASFTYTLNGTTFASLTSTLTAKYTGAGTGLYTANAITLSLSSATGVLTYSVTYNDGHVQTNGPSQQLDFVTGNATTGTGIIITRYTSTGVVPGTAPTYGTPSKNDFV